jgi:Predicted aminopeptidases
MRTGYIVLVLALVLAVWRGQTPTPAAVDAPATAFSAARAFTDINAIAQAPHPVGSAEHERVRSYVAARMTALGLAPRLQAAQSTRAFFGRIVSTPVTNVIGTLKGKDPHKPAVLVMSHYDSAPDSPGAADDTAGVAAALEIARAMKASGVPDRDVIFLVTDGEELGLMGAAAFFHKDPLAAHVGAVINFEARGDSGLAAMFETGPKNANAVALYAANAPRPSANSLSRVIYRNMPNGTDLSIALEKGLPGLNFAFIGDESAYHTPLATPAHLDLGSVQHMGDQALGAARAFAANLPSQTADAVYSDVLGFFLIQYPLWFGWVVLAGAAMLAFYGIRAAGKVAPASWGGGVIAAIFAIAVPAAVLVGAGLSFGELNHFLRLPHFAFLLAGAGALTVGLALAIAVPFLQRPIRPAALWQVLLLLLLVLGTVAQALVPEAAFVLVWPVLIGGAMASVRFGISRGRGGAISQFVCGVLALVQLAMTAAFAIAIFTALGVDLPVVLFLPVLTGLPILFLLPTAKPGMTVPLVLVVAGVALFAYGRFAPPTAGRPGPTLVRYVKDLDSGKAYRVAYRGSLDPWAEKTLGEPRNAPLPWTERKTWWAPTAAADVPDTDVVMLREGRGLRIAVQPRPGASSVDVTVKSENEFAASTFDGVKLAPAKRQDFEIHAPGKDGFSLAIATPTGKVDVVVTTHYPNWPAGAAPLPALPKERMAFNGHATTETVKQRTWTP